MRLIAGLYLLISFVCSGTKLLALKDDSLKLLKPAKHYFNSMIYTDFYGTGKRDLNQENFVSQKLKSYQVNQFVLGFNTPLSTKDYYNKDSTIISNFHLLLAGSYVSVTPKFDGVGTAHRLSKFTIGTGEFIIMVSVVFFMEKYHHLLQETEDTDTRELHGCLPHFYTTVW